MPEGGRQKVASEYTGPETLPICAAVRPRLIPLWKQAPRCAALRGQGTGCLAAPMVIADGLKPLAIPRPERLAIWHSTAKDNPTQRGICGASSRPLCGRIPAGASL
jgi:hypothetical protein